MYVGSHIYNMDFGVPRNGGIGGWSRGFCGSGHCERLIGNVSKSAAIHVELHVGSENNVDPKVKFEFAFPEQRPRDVALDDVSATSILFRWCT